MNIIKVYAVELVAPRDTYGTARGGFLIYDEDGDLIGFANINQSCRSRALEDAERTIKALKFVDVVRIIHMCTLNVPGKEYRQAKTHAQL